VIGVSLGLLGGGGSILTVPVLIYVLGYPVKTAIPMSLVVVGITSLLAAAGHARAGMVHWRAAAAFGPPAVLGALAGAQLGLRVPAGLQLGLFAVIMMLAAGAMWAGPQRWARTSAPGPRPLGRVGLLGAAVGVLTGLVGVGGGFLYVPVLVLLAGLDMKPAVGTSLLLIVLSSAAGLARYAGAVALEWQVIAVFTGLAFLGALAGTRLGRRASPESLRRGFAVLLLMMGVAVLLRGP